MVCLFQLVFNKNPFSGGCIPAQNICLVGTHKFLDGLKLKAFRAKAKVVGQDRKILGLS